MKRSIWEKYPYDDVDFAEDQPKKEEISDKMELLIKRLKGEIK